MTRTAPITGLCTVFLLSLAATSGAQDPPAAMARYVETIAGTAVELPMVPLPAGTEGYPAAFRMGSPESEAGRADDEGPTFEVEVEPFWIGAVEVTWDTFDVFRAEYEAQLDKRLVRDATDDAQWLDAVSLPTPLFEQDSAPILAGMGTAGGYPVANITQYAAKQFTKWLSKKTGRFYRLPTEAEWEYAARAGSTTAYCFGDDPEQLGDYAWFFDNSAYDDPDRGHPEFGAGYRKVGNKKPNAWGLHDLHGNVAEWVIDQYAADAYAAFGGGETSWRDAVRFPAKTFPCVVRGGSWESDPERCRSAARQPSTAQWQHRDPQVPRSIWWFTDGFHVGFRVVRPLREPEPAERSRFWEAGDETTLDVVATGGKELRAPIDAAKK